MSEGGTLKTFALIEVQGQKRWTETIIDLDRVSHVLAYPLEDYPGTCFVQYCSDRAIHVDQSLQQMRRILDEHKRNPLKNFDTHCDMSDEVKTPTPRKQKSKTV